ncbi:MAG TPA: ferredoxin [Amycolatopsis sp.]|uniref:ferredoxin n=1 Tax=Amycolatopsis sp. TaxID=37632 RepID=UPI002B4892AF|nr:ferredoxin [Amycolatopsis sp.]HKS47000.1 ferredoxin [Amycolatopsis sp.]
MKVTVDWDACASTGSCVQICPDVFTLDPDGRLQVLAEPDESLRPEVAEAADMCPNAAITLDE